MNRIFYAYTLAKTLYEQGKDYVDTFWPFVLKVLPENRSTISLVSIQEKLKEDFGLNVPQYTLKTIMGRAEGKGCMVAARDRYRLTEKGSQYLDHLEPESAVERRVNALLEDIKKYLNEQLELSLSVDKVRKILLSFVGLHLYPLIECFMPDSGTIELHIPRREMLQYEDGVVRYFKVAEKRKPTFHETLKDIVYGSVISTIASSPNISEADRGFTDTVAFLDSNFLFGVLELNYPEFSVPAKELLGPLKRYQIALKVFNFIIDEMVGVLRNYPSEQHMYPTDVRVDSIYGALKRRGWTAEDVRLFIQNIEQEVQNLGIEIEKTDIELKTYKPEKEEYSGSISTYKGFQTIRSRNHDLAAIEQIKKIRGSPKRQIETSAAFLLTSDLKLSRFNFEEMGHREKVTVCEVIPDRLLSNILWLKNPAITEEIPLKSIVAVHSREMFVDRNVWKRFYENLRKLREEGRIDDRDFSMPFYDHQIEEVLSEVDISDIEKITPDFVVEKVGQITNKVETRIKMRSDRRAKRYVGIGSWISAGAVAIVLLMFIPKVIEKWDVVEPVAWTVGILASIIIPVLGRKITLGKIRRRLETRLSKTLYDRKVREVEELFGGTIR